MSRIAYRPGPAGQRGFTLVELMVTVAVVGIIALVAVPGMRALVDNSRLTGMTGEMTASLQLARSEAIRRNAPVTVCATDGSSTATTACANDEAWANWAILDLTKNTIADRVIRNETAAGPIQLSGPAAGIQFNPSGLTNGQVELTVCAPDTSLTQNQRSITVLVSGSIVTEDASGTCP